MNDNEHDEYSFTGNIFVEGLDADFNEVSEALPSHISPNGKLFAVRVIRDRWTTQTHIRAADKDSALKEAFEFLKTTIPDLLIDEIEITQ